MTSDLKTVVGIDHGSPPDVILRQQEKVNQILKSDGGSVGPAEELGDSPALEAPVPPVTIPLPVIRRPLLPTERVSLQFVPETGSVPAFKLEFDVVEVCVKEYYVSLLIASDLGFEPAGTMKFRLTYKGSMYPVIFAGAEFEFKSVNVRGISFLRDKKVEETSK